MKNSTEKVVRGEIYYYDFGQNNGSVQGGVRPVLVVQCDEGNTTSPTTVVAAITTAVKKQYLPSHIFLGQVYGLKRPSMVMLEQLKTVNQSELQRCVGLIDDPNLMRLINIGLKKALGMWFYQPKDQSNVRCLCTRCLEDYKANPHYIVRRLDPFSREKHRCDKCLGYGYEYIVTERKQGIQRRAQNV